MSWTANTIGLLFIGWMLWLLWAALGPLLWIPTSPDGWDRVPRLLGLYRRAARRRIDKIPDDKLPPAVKEVAVVLEAQERWLTWRLLAVVFSGLLVSFVPLTLIMFCAPSDPERDQGAGLALDRLPSALGVVTVAILPLIVTATALVVSASRLSRIWPSDVGVWRYLHTLLRDEACPGWRGPALRRTAALRNLAAALERDFMRVAAVSDPSQLQHHRRAVVGGVLDLHDRLVHRPNRTIPPALLRRFAGDWLAGDWPSLRRGTIRDHPALPRREPWLGRRGVVVVVVAYLALAAAVFLGSYDDHEARSSIVGGRCQPGWVSLRGRLLSWAGG